MQSSKLTKLTENKLHTMKIHIIFESGFTLDKKRADEQFQLMHTGGNKLVYKKNTNYNKHKITNNV